MSDYALIAKQSMKIEFMKHQNKEYLRRFGNIYLALFGIGAPLNDNCLGFNAEQLKYLQDFIASEIPEGFLYD